MFLGESNKLNELITITLSELAKHEYKESYINHHRHIYSALQQCCKESSIDYYSEVVGKQFLDAVKEQKPSLRHHTMNEYRMSVHRLNCALSGTKWQPLGKKCIPYVNSCYDDIIAEYEIYLYRKGKTKCDVRGHMHTIARFLRFVEQQRVSELTNLTPKCIYDAFKDSTNKCGFQNIIGTFLRYAYNYKLIDANLSIIVPGVFHHTPVPTVYSPEEIEVLLSSIDRTTEIGKRNYAIILIAARLGLRSCDIAEMKFGCLHSETSRIEIVQIKTKQPLILPLLDEVKSAIDDYIDNDRPPSTDEHIFLNLRGYGAVSPQSVQAIVRRAFEQSGVNRGNRKHGSHALRSSLATALLVEGNDYPTIQRVLGHRNIQSSKSYVKADIERLRINALPVPQPTANYEVLLSNVGTVI
jgi:site-specific recombinase XerD